MPIDKVSSVIVNNSFQPKAKTSAFTGADNNLERSPKGDEIKFNKDSNKGIFKTFGEKIIEKLDNATEELRRKKELKILQARCESMISNYEKTQEIFKDIYLRNDIKLNSTLNMIREFNELEQMRINGERNKYINGLFNVAKRNYGFENLPMEIKLTDKPIMNNDNIIAYTTPLGDVIMRSDIPDKDILNTIHHELRHAKQRYMAFNLSPNEYVKYNQPKNMELPVEIFCIAFGEPNESYVRKYNDFAQNSLNAVKNYAPVNKNEAEHYQQWAEEDARATGEKIEKLLRG